MSDQQTADLDGVRQYFDIRKQCFAAWSELRALFIEIEMRDRRNHTISKDNAEDQNRVEQLAKIFILLRNELYERKQLCPHDVEAGEAVFQQWLASLESLLG
jgi:hypothetical protein